MAKRLLNIRTGSTWGTYRVLTRTSEFVMAGTMHMEDVLTLC
jgi:hypothetical protein